MTGSRAFPIVAIATAAAGISIYAFLYIRSGLHPVLNEADPENWHSLLAVIGREQFGSRGMFDNPMLPGSPRTLTVFGQQLFNYIEYFTWQWGRSLLPAGRLLAFLVFLILGSAGFEFARRRDRGIAYLPGPLWLGPRLRPLVFIKFQARGFSVFGYVSPLGPTRGTRAR